MTTMSSNAVSPVRVADRLAPIALLLAGAVLLLMMLVGLAMIGTQGNLVTIDPVIFYRLMTAHGAGMVGAAGLSGAAIMWHFLGRHVSLNGGIFVAFLAIFLIGVVLILGAIFVGGFGAGWTFLFPLPAKSAGAWDIGAAAAFLLGLAAIGVAFLLLYLETGRAILARYGTLSRALAWPLIFRGRMDEVPPPTIIAASAVITFNTIGTVVGAAVLVISLVNLVVPTFAIDPLLAKNMTYFFGHVFINASIYMAVIGVYEIMPEYTGRPWKSSRLFAIAWSSILLFVMAVYPHHLLQDTVMPGWALVLGQVVSYLSGVPLLAVTAFGLLGYVRGSDLKWDLASALLFIGVFGWSIGVVPAIIDGMISVNKLMHNTQWVPGHFHTYLLLGEVAMSFGVMAWLVRGEKVVGFGGLERAAFWAYVVGALGFVLAFLTSGAMSIPRRWAAHAPEWFVQDRIGTAFALVTIFGATCFVVRYVMRLPGAVGSR
jgi:cytochrome c oxidase subunit I